MATGGHIALANGGQFTLVSGGQFAWIFHQATGTPKIGLYTPDNELISEYEIIDGIYRNVVSGWPLAGRGYNAYMSRYKDCVGQYIQTMADMPLVGIMCLYFGRECAVSTLLICFASSLSFR